MLTPMAPITSYSRLLVANRGEIALRIMRSAHELGLSTIAVYSDADAGARHVRSADAAVRIGPAPAVDSYLSIPALLQAALDTGADAIHPGYGFLAENAAFAQAVQEAGLVFIGPNASVIELMGRKERARAAALAAGLDVLAARVVEDDLLGDARAIEAIDYPVLIKAVAGGGGKGMRIVRGPVELAEAVAAARRESLSSFGDDMLLMERLVDGGRHVEVQVMADQHGNVVHVGDRDCTAQRRHQKVLEEAPASDIDSAVRSRILAGAVELARSVGYVGAGTVEFLVRGDESFFLEMNTRLQVEHPVTEAVSGTDLVALQLIVADGQALPMTQAGITMSGHAIEARVYAEDPFGGFLPQAGRVVASHWPQDVRVETALEDGVDVSTHYDPMLAKVIAHGATREQARQRLIRALRHTLILGITTNVGLLIDLLETADFAQSRIHTRWLDELNLPGLPAGSGGDDAAAIAAWILAGCPGLAAHERDPHPFADSSGWRIDGHPAAIRVALAQGSMHRVLAVSPDAVGAPAVATVEHIAQDGASRTWTVGCVAQDGPWLVLDVSGRLRRSAFAVEGRRIEVVLDGCRHVFLPDEIQGPAGRAALLDASVLASMPGRLIEVRAREGDAVAVGDVLGVLEAMKMEMPLRAAVSGVVVTAPAAPGQQVALGEVLFVIEPDLPQEARDAA